MTASIKLDARLFLATVIALAIGFVFFPNRASATLAGENGLIVYVENEKPEEKCAEVNSTESVQERPTCEEPENEVVTTAPDGTSETVAATDDNTITAATISAPNEDGNNEIVYAVSEPYCISYEDWDAAEERGVAMPPISEREPCEHGWMKPFNYNAVLNHVEVDADGNPLANPTTILDLDPENENAPGMQMVEKLSYSPDGDNVVMTRVELSFDNHDIGITSSIMNGGSTAMWTVEKVTVETGDVETLVDPRSDPWVSAGYAQNGAVYFSMSDEEYDNHEKSVVNRLDDRRSSGINLWYIPAGGNKDDAQQLTFSKDINEFFLSVSPDNSKVLVCDPSNGLYYYINTADGSALQLNLERGFRPIGFSPDGTMLLGNYYSKNPMEAHCGGKMVRNAMTTMDMRSWNDEEFARGIAVAMRTALEEDPTVINDELRGAEDWAPKYVAVVEEDDESPKVLADAITVTPVLQSTGTTNTILSMVVGFFIVTVTTLTAVNRRQNS